MLKNGDLNKGSKAEKAKAIAKRELKKGEVIYKKKKSVKK